VSKIEIERPHEGVAVVRLNRPQKMNALDDELLCQGLPAAVHAVDEDRSVSVVIFTGTGRAFCGGADLEACSGWTREDPASAEDFVRWTCEVPVAIRKMRPVSIAAVNGPAVGAGFGLALACDFRFVATAAFFLSPFITMGLAPDYGLSYFLPRLVGMSDALDIMLTGRRVGAEEAQRLGIAWKVGDQPLEDALEYAGRLAGQAPRAVAVTRANLYRGQELDVETEILVEEARSQGVALHGAEFRERFATWQRRIVGSGSGGE
jgi:enoyl-CoA hydratase/carnithine racemase